MIPLPLPLPPITRPRSLRLYFLPKDESGFEKEVFCWNGRGSTRIAGGRWQHFPLKILGKVSSSGSGAGIAVSHHWGAVLWRWLKFQTCTNVLNNFFNNSGNCWVLRLIYELYLQFPVFAVTIMVFQTRSFIYYHQLLAKANSRVNRHIVLQGCKASVQSLPEVDSGYNVSCTVPRSVFTVLEVSWKSVNENIWVIHECDFISYSKWPVSSTYRLPWLSLNSLTHTTLISVFLLLFRTWALFEFFALKGRTSTLQLIFSYS